MISSINVKCPSCRARIKAPAQLLGQMRKCPGCGYALRIQVKPPDDAGPMLLLDEIPEPAQTPAPVSRLGAARKKEEKIILLVDDDRELNDGLRFLLEKQGHRVIQAFDGVQAKAMVHEHRPDLMILDMMMPLSGGYPVLEHLNKLPESLPVIMITAKEGSQHKLYAEYLGVVDYLNKPFPIERFLASVEKGLDRTKSESVIA